MCGICGIFCQGENKITDQTIRTVSRMTVLMKRRGPDDEGLWHDERCALGFRRLSILDLTPTGHQPMISRGGRFIFVRILKRRG